MAYSYNLKSIYSVSLYINIIILALTLLSATSNKVTNGEQLSTVFVLETSDGVETSAAAPSSNNNNNINNNNSADETVSSPPKAQATGKSLGQDSNTRIITDDGSKPESHVVVRPHSNQTPPKLQHNQQQQNIPSSEQSEESPSSTLKTLTSTRNVNSISNNNNNNNYNYNQNSNQNTRQRTTSTTASPYQEQVITTTPKTEERLLISISNDDDDSYSYNKQPAKQLVGGLNQNLEQDYQAQPSTTTINTNGPPKKKHTITISIQDNNLKQNGGLSQSSGGTAAVIVRPSENGQSILISTINNSGGSSGLGINQNSINKPSNVLLVNNNNNREPPYASSTTYRPSVVVPINNNEYIPNNQRPINSGGGSSISQQQRPLPSVALGSSEERPQRPQVVSLGNDGDSSTFESSLQQQRPQTSPRPNINQRPPLATQEPSVSSGFESGNDYTRPVNQPLTNNNNNNNNNEIKYPLNERNCGTMHDTRIVGGDAANPDDFLWMAAIIKSRPKEGDPRPFCGGSLITKRHILTAAHCLENLAPRDVLVRLGSYDFDDATASATSADLAIDQFRVPANYSKKTHVADIAIMRLKTPLTSSDNYKTVCMPQPRRSYVGAYGTVTGYGSQSQTFRKATPQLRQVTVPIWENRKCSVVYKKNLTDSFMCAGFEEGGKDACQGDSGGPLMTDGPNERMMVVGVVSHGIGCGAPGYPGVYTRTTTFLDWIEKNTRE